LFINENEPWPKKFFCISFSCGIRWLAKLDILVFSVIFSKLLELFLVFRGFVGSGSGSGSEIGSGAGSGSGSGSCSGSGLGSCSC